MKYIVLIYNDPRLLGALPKAEFDASMRECLAYADGLREQGRLLDAQMLEEPATAKSIRVRAGKRTVTDGPFAEAKEVIAGFNLIEARDMDEAMEMAGHFPWASTGCVEVRPVREIATVRDRVAL